LFENAPKSIREIIFEGINGAIPDTPKSGDPVFNKVHNIIIGNNSIAVSSAYNKAIELGYNSMILSTYIEGEARIVGEFLTGIAKEILYQDRPLKKPAAVIMGGETTVPVRGAGVGGRNQELVLGASEELSELSCLIASLGTDGIDGPTEVAGAIIDGNTFDRSIKLGLNKKEYLYDNNSYNFFKQMGDTIITGPTGTNVNDITIILLN
jgi:glycerate-2-kinase